MGSYWLIVNDQNQVIDDHKLYCNEQISNKPKAAEAISLLDLIATIMFETKDINVGSMVFFIDNKKVANEINNDKSKANCYIHDASLVIEKIKQIINEAII